MSEFTLFQPNALHCMHYGKPGVITPQDWFVKAMSLAYGSLASVYNCEVDLSKRRLLEARKHWQQDLERVILDGDSERPDHFKEAGFLAYWLRRRIVVNESSKISGAPNIIYLNEFLEYTNEFLAFLVGFRVCLFFEATRASGAARVDMLHQYRLNIEYLKDVAVLLHHKNVSPHSLYIIYRSLFYNFKI